MKIFGEPARQMLKLQNVKNFRSSTHIFLEGVQRHLTWCNFKELSY